METIDASSKVDGKNRKWWAAMLRDVHFWVPLAVLLGGLILLKAIQ